MKTVRVRIAVGVGADGQWVAMGMSCLRDGVFQRIHDARAGTAIGKAMPHSEYDVTFVEADVSFPGGSTAEGVVKS